MECTLKCTLRTEILGDEKIVQTLVRDQVETLSRWVCDTRELGTREALISLGWTPPSQPSTSADAEGRCGWCEKAKNHFYFNYCPWCGRDIRRA